MKSYLRENHVVDLRVVDGCGRTPEQSPTIVARPFRVSGMTQEDYIRKLCQTRVVDTDSELEVQKLFDHKAKHGEIPVYEASRLIDRLKACSKKGKVA